MDQWWYPCLSLGLAGARRADDFTVSFRREVGEPIHQHLTAYPFEITRFWGRPLNAGWITNRLARGLRHPYCAGGCHPGGSADEIDRVAVPVAGAVDDRPSRVHRHSDDQ